MIDNGIVDYPEVWLWHIPGTAWGKADMITYSDGFAIAGGHVYEGKEHVADALAQSASKGSDIAVSHGMPANWLVRDPEDPTVINFHITNEISPLPRYAAANKMTGFMVFSTGEREMSIPASKKDWLIDEAGLSPEWVEKLESGLAKQREDAENSGQESKESVEDEVVEAEAAEEVVEAEVAEKAPEELDEEVAGKEAEEVEEVSEPVMEEVEEAEVAEETPEPAPEPEVKQADSITREEIADVLAAVIKSNEEAVASLESRVKELEVEISTLKKSDEEKIVEMKEETPSDSLASLLSARVIGSDAARIDGRTSLAKDGPEEKESSSAGRTPVRFVNELMGSQVNQ